MVVNGFQLPAAFVRLCGGIRDGGVACWPLGEGVTHWELKSGVDAYGNPWETDLDLYCDLEAMRSETAELPSSTK